MTPSPGREILLVTDEDRVALAVARALGRAGHAIALATPERRPPAAASRWIGRVVALPDPLAGPPAEFAGAVIAAARAAPPALLVAAGDLAIAALAPFREELARISPLEVPAAPLVALWSDRPALLARAAAAGLDVPAHHLVDNYAAAQLLAERIAFPILVRPAARVQWGRGGRGARRRGLLVRDRAAFLMAAEEMLALGAAVAEEPLAGEQVGLTLLYAAGAPVAAVQHRVRHEIHGPHGAATYAETMAVDPALGALAHAFAAPLAPSGLLAIAFRVASGRARLLDVSLGPDESLPLAAASGVDLARAAVDLALGAGPPRLATAGPPRLATGRPGVRMRHLARDLAWHRERGFAELAGAVPGALAAAARLLGGREHLEIESFSDPGPALREGQELGARSLRALGRVGTRERARLVHLGAGPPRRLAARRVLVLCDGNICRSPFVEHLLRARLTAAADQAIVVESAGLRAALGHPAPPLARAAAARHGVDLSPHRSQPVTPALVAGADLILVMDLDQRARLIAAHPGVAEKVVLMARFDPERIASPEVPDPVFGDARTFDRVYARLIRATDLLATALTAVRGRREVSPGRGQ